MSAIGTRETAAPRAWRHLAAFDDYMAERGLSWVPDGIEGDLPGR